MASIRCDDCGREIDDWDGAVMADIPEGGGPGREVDRLRVLCQPCLGRLDGRAEHLFMMWKLKWLKDHYLWINKRIMRNLSGVEDDTRWSREAVDQFLAYGSIVFPEDSAGPSEE